MEKQGYLLFLALLAVAALLPLPVAGEATDSQVRINCSFNESHSEIYQQMLERNASLGEYYERICPGFLEGMPPELRAHLYNMTMLRHEPPCGDRTFVPPLVTGKVAIATASPVISVCGVPIALVAIVILGLVGIGILALLAAACLIRERSRNRNG